MEVHDIPRGNLDKLRETNIDKTKLSKKDPEAVDRRKWGRAIQFRRWQWAKDNITTYVNVLRAAGHTDDRIQNMLDGVPFCFASAEEYATFCRALYSMAPAIEAEMGWRQCGFVFTGSCVPGFSQNPAKGMRDIPSSIVDVGKSDIDICIVADGVNNVVTKLLSQDQASEPQKLFITTCTQQMEGVRFGCKNISAFCKTAAVSILFRNWVSRLFLTTDVCACHRRFPMNGRKNCRDAYS